MIETLNDLPVAKDRNAEQVWIEKITIEVQETH